ncbi:hypothetical protein SLA2020_038150 [Shorea laevis]
MAIAKIPGDVMQNILSRLPVKTLSRFKSVSRDFLGCISDSVFHQLHRLQSQKNPLLSLPDGDSPSNKHTRRRYHAHLLLRSPGPTHQPLHKNN